MDEHIEVSFISFLNDYGKYCSSSILLWALSLGVPFGILSISFSKLTDPLKLAVYPVVTYPIDLADAMDPLANDWIESLELVLFWLRLFYIPLTPLLVILLGISLGIDSIWSLDCPFIYSLDPYPFPKLGLGPPSGLSSFISSSSGSSIIDLSWIPDLAERPDLEDGVGVPPPIRPLKLSELPCLGGVLGLLGLY